MDFKFNVNRLLPRKINKITHTLIPEDFRPGDRREYNESQRQLSRIIDEMGEASAQAQGLSKPITSAAKLRDTDHIVYLLVDNAGNQGFGTVVGLLKTGSKNLFMFDETGAHYQLQPRCVLDFYVHETKQRMGFGKDLYQYMLAEEQIRPVKLAIDRPSEKFLRFLRRHYGLDGIIPQNNKFVVFQGFFDDECQDVRGSRYSLPTRGSIDSSYSYNNNSKPSSATSNGHSNLHSGVPRSSYGRYAAARPPCSMANIIHNAPMFGQAAERTGEVPSTPGPKLERPRSLSLYSEPEQNQRNNEISTVPTPAIESKPTPITREISIETEPMPEPEPEPPSEPEPEREPTPPERQPTPKPPESASKKSHSALSKSASNKSLISIHSEEQKTSSSIKPSPSCAQEVAGNQSGHLDLKFYHSPLW
ncbi:alpha-tubulin N-acetyltransferase-like [Chelonus insularis]|uniref:alpha-tubulin N-acetyltransferase-like n=1 Tax=Chelonus insularis TaxID=460826 RepID=UPI00158A8C29|nr:alpha-tubulin N-acetyltransferase-like [Chelonus insularis]